MNKQDITLKFDAKQITKWQRKKTKVARDKDRQDRIDKWEGKK